jgi:aminopeptidase-like protein
MGEPQLGRRGLYDAIGGENDQKTMQMALLWVLNMSDGHHDVIDIAKKSNLPLSFIIKACDLLLKKSLLREFEN